MVHRQESLGFKRGYRSQQHVCEHVDVRYEKHNTNFHATRAYVRVALFRPDINARSMLVNAHIHLHQVCVGNRNHRTEPVPVLRRAPTLSDEQRQQSVSLRALSPSEHLPKCAKERPGES